MRLVVLALLIAGCHRAPASTTVSTADLDRMRVDPTMPSWAPQECTAYHDAVVRLVTCDAVSPTERNVSKTQYNVDNARWKAMHASGPDSLDELDSVRSDCRSAMRDIEAANPCLGENEARLTPR